MDQFELFLCLHTLRGDANAEAVSQRDDAANQRGAGGGIVEFLDERAVELENVDR